MFPLNADELYSDSIEELEQLLISKGYPHGTVVYQAIFYPDAFPAFIVSIVFTETKSYLVLSAISSPVDGLKALMGIPDKEPETAKDDYSPPGQIEFWVNQTLLSPDMIALIQQAMAKLDPFTIKDLLKSAWPIVDSFELSGRVFKIGSSANEFGLKFQPLDPEVIRSKTFFDKILEFAALALPDPLSQECIAQLQREIRYPFLDSAQTFAMAVNRSQENFIGRIMFPLNADELYLNKIEELEKRFILKGYPDETLVYQIHFYPDSFPGFVVSIVLTEDKSHLILSAMSSNLADIKAHVQALNGESKEPQKADHEHFSASKPFELWLDQTLLSPKDIELIQQEMAKLDPFAIKDLLKPGWPTVDGIMLIGRVFKLGGSSHEFGLKSQPPKEFHPEVLRSKPFFDKMLEFAALTLSDPLSQACVAELQRELS